MVRQTNENGLKELRAARAEGRAIFWAVGLFSVFANFLMLSGPLYMMQVYDRVLGSRSIATLIALTGLIAFLYLIMGLLDYSRGRLMARAGARFQERLDRRVFDAAVRKSSVSPDEISATALRDLESIQKLLTSPALMSMFDAPWTPIFLFGMWLFHPLMGMLAIGGGIILILLTLLNRMLSNASMIEANTGSFRADRLSDHIQSEAELIQSMGMRDAAFDMWQKRRDEALRAHIASSDVTGVFSTATKIFRMFLQSAVLGLGAFLVIHDHVTPGVMIASSILMGRALAPVEQLIGQWALFQRARKGWDNLSILLSEVPVEPNRTELPKPKAILSVQNLTIVPPGQTQASLRMVSFDLPAGHACGVIGPSGSGKSTLARALTGVWRPAGGQIRLDGATLDQFEHAVLGQHIGYLPQRVHLFEGTIAENISKLSQSPDAEAVVAAAQKADAHEMILKLPQGYDTRVSANGGQLSGGQIQRIGLARAMYGDPVLLILDEPNSNLDNEGSEALNTAIRNMKAVGKSVLIMAHRPAAIKECDMLLMLDGGNKAAFGPKEEVLQSMVKNHQQIKTSSGLGGLK